MNLMTMGESLTMSSREIQSMAEEFGRENPKSIKGEGFVYYVLLSNGVLKVGYSKATPETRIAAHRRVAKISQASVTSSKVFKVCGARGLESFLISMLSKSHKQISREWFHAESSDFVEKVIAAWPFEKGDSLVEDDARGAVMDEGLDRLLPVKKRSESGHVWMECFAFAKALAKRAEAGVPKQYTSNMSGFDLSFLELTVWIALYQSDSEVWVDLALMAEDSPGDFFNFCERIVKDSIKEHGIGGAA